MNKKDKRSVGRPKLADTKLKKNSLIMSGIMLLIVASLVLGGLISLNIMPKFGKLKGESYKTYKLGDEFCLDTECFYVLEDNGDTVTALAKYGLLVGGYGTNETKLFGETSIKTIRVISYDYIPETTEGYGLQSSDLLPYSDVIGESNFYGTIGFSENSYWSDENSNVLKTEYGKSYPTFVYDKNSKLYKPLQDYENYIRNSLNKKSVSVSLMNLEQVVNIGCNIETTVCENTPDFIDLVNGFYTGIAYDSTYIYVITNDGIFPDAYTCGEGLDAYNVVRPIITINKSDFAEVVPETSVGNDYELGQEICLDTECFYVMEDNGDSVTALSEYNISIDTNKQASGTNPIDFSNTNYWYDNENFKLKEGYGDNYPTFVYDENSNLYEHIEKYQKYLREELGKTSASLSLMTLKQSVILGCDLQSYSCKDAPSWVYQTSYWFGDARDLDDLWAMINIYEPALIYPRYSADTHFGIRPVMTISKEDLKEKNQEETTSSTTTSSTRESSVTISIKQSASTSNKVTTSKKSFNISGNKKITTTTTKENIIINKIVSNNKITTVKNNKKIENRKFKPILLVTSLLIVLLVVGYVTYRKAKDKNK